VYNKCRRNPDLFSREAKVKNVQSFLYVVTSSIIRLLPSCSKSYSGTALFVALHLRQN